jgi:hypothetical protein
LVACEAEIEHCQQYGVRGQEQHGIDLYGRLRAPAGTFAVYQCKRVNAFGPSDIVEAVDRFLDGRWVNSAKRFTLCTTESLVRTERADALELQTKRLRRKRIQFVPWDLDSISARLKSAPEIVDDFFGRNWVLEFCGRQAAEGLGPRLDRARLEAFRQGLGRFYARVFALQDPGLPTTINAVDAPRPLHERYAIPEIVAADPNGPVLAQPRRILEQKPPDPEQLPRDAGQEPVFLERPDRVREGIEAWLCRNKKSIVLGGPGTGKSALLKYIVLDLFSPEPHLSRLAAQWGHLLPVWLPFAFWSKLIEERSPQQHGIADAIKAWLEFWGEGHLWQLVQDAIRDRRLLLIVDGLDEWSSEAAGHVGSHLLQNLVDGNDGHAIVTSRPSGFRRVPIHAPSWQLGELAPLSESQRHEIVRKWFGIRASREAEASDGELDATRLADMHADRFISELSSRSELEVLSQVPMFLLLLIYLKFQNAALPRRRFEAYESLVDHLVRVHPMAKQVAASVVASAADGLGARETQEVLAHVAFWIHTERPTGILGDAELRQVVEAYLADDELGLGLERPVARRHATRFADVAEGTLGILVRQGLSELSFFHRSMQEYLAAAHAARLPHSTQRDLVRRRAADPLWREVVFGLIWFARRPGDAADLVADLRGLGTTDDDVGQSCRELLAEVVFGDVQCPASLAREVAVAVLDTVRDGEWVAHRERLLPHVVEGLRSAKLRDLVATHIDQWLFSNRSVYRPGCFAALVNWPLDDLTLSVCKGGMNDEDPGIQRAAIFCIAQVGKDDAASKILLRRCATKSLDPFRRAAAIEAYVDKWPDPTDLDECIRDAQLSPSPALQYAAIAARIHLQKHDEGDKKQLLEMVGSNRMLPYQWAHLPGNALIAGWRGDPEIKEHALDALSRSGGGEKMDRDIAYSVLLRGFPKDGDLAARLIKDFEHERYPLLSSHGDAWELLASAFKGHGPLMAAIDKWIAQDDSHSHRPRELALISGIGKTDAMKRALISSLQGSFPHWGAEALQEHWGNGDQEVASALQALVDSPRAALAGRVVGAVLPPEKARGAKALARSVG